MGKTEINGTEFGTSRFLPMFLALMTCHRTKPSSFAPDDDETYSWAMSSHEDSEASCEQDEHHTLTVGKAQTGGDGDGGMGGWDE